MRTPLRRSIARVLKIARAGGRSLRQRIWSDAYRFPRGSAQDPGPITATSYGADDTFLTVPYRPILARLDCHAWLSVRRPERRISRDSSDQRSSRWATGDPERERSLPNTRYLSVRSSQPRSALSVSGAMLVGFRVIQGIGGAVMSSLTLSLISEAYPPEARTGPIGLWAAVSGLAVAGGSVLGGLLLSVFPWSSIFWVNVPIGGRDRGHLPGRSHRDPGAGTPLLRRPGGRAECLRPAAADLRVRRLR